MTTVYWVLMVGGGTFLVFGWLFGGHHFHHGLLAHGHGVAHHLNLLNIAAFAAGFGAVGTIGTASVWNALIALLIAIVVGLAMAVFSAWFIERMVANQTTSQPDDDDLKGIAAQVVVGIPAWPQQQEHFVLCSSRPSVVQCGEIRAVVRSQILTVRAVPHLPDQAFQPGDRVITMDYQGGVASVIRDAAYYNTLERALNQV